MKYFSLSDPLGKGIRVVLLLVMLVLNFGPGASVAYAAPPVHDDFNSAKLINAIEYHDLNVNTRDATPSDTIPNVDDPDQFPCQGATLNYGFASVWYKYTPPEQQSISLNTFGTTPASYDTFIAVWTGTRGNLNLIACNDEIVENDDAELSFVANAGTTYYIEVAQFNDGLGSTHFIGGDLQFNAYITNTNVYVGDSFVARYFVPSGGSLRKSFINLDNGPVQVINLAGNQIVAAERVIYRVNNIPTSFSEMMGLPNALVNMTYWMPYYNSVDMETQLRFGNVSASTATVHVYIGGVEKTTGCTPSSSPYTLQPGASIRINCPGVSAGPVKIQSNVNIVAAERVIYKVNNTPTSFSEMMGLPNSQINNVFWMPYYNNIDLDTQLRIANITTLPATIQVWIAGVLREQFPLGGGQTARKSYAVSAGPVRIVSTQSIVASERVIFKVNGLPVSFSEMMGLPNGQLNTVYWMPWYNNVDLDTQLRIANVSGTAATVRLYIGGVEKTSGCSPSNSPYTIPVGGSVRISCAGANNGPVKIESNVNVVAAERVIYNVFGKPTSFSEMMGLPNSLLAVSYWMPWYNNVALDTQLRFGMP